MMEEAAGAAADRGGEAEDVSPADQEESSVVQVLRAMFPGVEADVIEAVLESQYHQLSRTIDSLLELAEQPEVEPPAPPLVGSVVLVGVDAVAPPAE